MTDQSKARVAQNRHRLGIEQQAASELRQAQLARARGEEPTTEYVPLWRR